MHIGSAVSGRTIVATLRYQDVAAAMDWLSRTLGFAEHHVVRAEDGSVQYAELAFGDGLIMLAPGEAGQPQSWTKEATAAAASGSQACYLYVSDIHAHRDAAKAAGADIMLDLEDEASHGLGYSCRDPEGHVWNLGSYDPWKRPSAGEGRGWRLVERAVGAVRHAAMMLGFVVMTLASAAAVAWSVGLSLEPIGTISQPAALTTQSLPAEAPDTRVREAMERELRSAREAVVRERVAREHAEQARESAERTARQGVDRKAAAEAHERLASAERTAAEARSELAIERAARAATDRAAREAREQLARERSLREATERASKEAREQAATKERAARKPPPRRRMVQQPYTEFVWQ